MTAEKEVAILFAGSKGFLDKWPISAVADYEKQMLEFLSSKYVDILTDIKEKSDITEETEGNLKKALEEFEGIFQPAA